MNAWEIKGRIESALMTLFKYDIYLLQKGIHERTIAHKLAIYLQCVFPEYDVDCEYNGNVLQDNGKKYIHILKNELERLGLLSPKEEMVDKEVIDRLVYPDIVIHKRNTHQNLCIIEVKKPTSKILTDYDKLKLRCYTSSDNENNLKWYWDGKENPEEKLKELGEIT